MLHEANAKTLTAATNFTIANLTQALNDHDCMKRSTDILLFYASHEKDTVFPHILIDRIEDAAAIATWDEARKMRAQNVLLGSCHHLVQIPETRQH